jgi:hypothetical protein
LIFLAAIAVGLFFVAGNLGGGSKDTQKVPVKIDQSQKTTDSAKKNSASQTETGENQQDSESAGFQVYEYKDPFEPLIKKDAAGTGVTSSSGTTTPATDTSGQGGTTSAVEDGGTSSSAQTPTGPQVLEVQDIYTENGTKYSSVKYGSTVYKVKEGDQVDDSPYQVLTIGTGNVIFLYGDRRVEVKVGESILK